MLHRAPLVFVALCLLATSCAKEEDDHKDIKIPKTDIKINSDKIDNSTFLGMSSFALRDAASKTVRIIISPHLKLAMNCRDFANPVEHSPRIEITVPEETGSYNQDTEEASVKFFSAGFEGKKFISAESFEIEVIERNAHNFRFELKTLIDEQNKFNGRRSARFCDASNKSGSGPRRTVTPPPRLTRPALPIVSPPRIAPFYIGLTGKRYRFKDVDGKPIERAAYTAKFGVYRLSNANNPAHPDAWFMLVPATLPSNPEDTANDVNKGYEAIFFDEMAQTWEAADYTADEIKAAKILRRPPNLIYDPSVPAQVGEANEALRDLYYAYGEYNFNYGYDIFVDIPKGKPLNREYFHKLRVALMDAVSETEKVALFRKLVSKRKHKILFNHFTTDATKLDEYNVVIEF